MKQNLKDFGIINIVIGLGYLVVATLYFVTGVWTWGIVWVVFSLLWAVVGWLQLAARRAGRREWSRWEEYKRTGDIQSLYTTKQNKRKGDR